MYFEAHQLYHVYNRGNNRQQVFFTPDNYLFFLKKLRYHLRPHCHILAYCLMPNHFHLLLYTTPTGTQERPTASSLKQPLTQGIAAVLSSYAHALNKLNGNSGAVFQAKTKIKLVSGTDENYPRACFHYLHQNPVRAQLATTLAAWPYASYRDYAGLRGGTLCDQMLARELLDLPADHASFQSESERAINVDTIQGWI